MAPIPIYHFGVAPINIDITHITPAPYRPHHNADTITPAQERMVGFVVLAVPFALVSAGVGFKIRVRRQQLV